MAEVTPEVEFVSAVQLDRTQRSVCANLVYDAGRGYYDLIGADRTIVEEQIADELGESGTELEHTFVATVGSEVAGMYSCINTDLLPSAMMEGTLKLLRGLDPRVRLEFLSQLRESRPSLPDLPENSLYLARVAVAGEYRGQGVAEALMEDFFHRRRSEASCCLHVLAENTRALRFFERLGFERLGEEESGYLSMVRAAG